MEYAATKAKTQSMYQTTWSFIVFFKSKRIGVLLKPYTVTGSCGIAYLSAYI